MVKGFLHEKKIKQKILIILAILLIAILVGYIVLNVKYKFIPKDEVFAFGIVFISVPLFFVIWELVRKKIIYIAHKLKKCNLLLLGTIGLFWLLDFFYLAIVNDCLMWRYTLGILVIALIISMLIDMISKEGKFPIFSIIVDLLIAVGISCYLIYIIPKQYCGLREIVSSVVAALYGGILTLLGVVLTIKRGEKNKNLPCIKILTENEQKGRVDTKITIKFLQAMKNQEVGKDLNSRMQKNYFNDILIENISSTYIIIEKIEINGYKYDLNGDKFLDSRESVRIAVSEYCDFTVKTKATVRLYIKNSFKREYYIDFKLEGDMLDDKFVISDGDRKYEFEQIRYTVVHTYIPKEIKN